MDQARVETQVDAAVTKYGVTGQGVIVAIMDRGIDWRNNDFRNTNGSTRIAAILDLTDDSGSNSPANPYGVGTLYTRQQINGALTYGTNLVTRDALGHGTATAGIACGNGNNVWKYRGVAYNATIVVVKIVAENVPAHGNQPAETAFYDPTRIPVAIQFVLDQAKALGLPAVMLLNIGSSGGPMDGTSSLCQAINRAVGPGIPGLVFVTGSSDDGGMPNHAAGTVSQNGTAMIKINNGDPGPLYFDLWYSSTDRFNVTIGTPSGTFGPYVSPASDDDYDIQSTPDFLYYHLGGDVNFDGTSVPEREIWLEINGPTGTYTVSLSGTTVTNGHFNASLNPSQFWNTAASSNYFASYAVSGSTVWDLASATNNICPNDYVHRTNWVDINGLSESISGEGSLGQLWQGSGIGPTYDGRIGVDVSAPGDSVFTTYNTNSYWETFQFNLIQDGLGFYGRASATSAASPLVTGIIALMLQMNPKLDAAMVKQILHQSARTDSFTGTVPNPQWGYGKVNASNALAIVQTTLPGPPAYVFSFGTFGSVHGQFYDPVAIAVDAGENVYVGDWTQRIQKFNNQGNFLTLWGDGANSGLLSNPYNGVALDTIGNVYVSDTASNQIEKFSGSGVLLAKWGSSGTNPGQFDGPSGVAINESNDVYVVDSSNFRLQVLSTNGNFLGQWGSYGASPSQFYFPVGTAVDTTGKIYVADTYNNRVQKFDASGNYLASWGSLGTNAGQFNHPIGIAVDGGGNVYVADTVNNRIQKFANDGIFLAQWGSTGTNAGQFSDPYGVGVDMAGKFIYVADTYNQRVQVFGYAFAPFITSQPISQVTKSGGNVTFMVVASSPSPFGYKWFLNGTNLPTATGSSLTITNALYVNAGNYQVIVSNIYGSTTSSVATLAVSVPAAPPSYAFAFGSIGSGPGFLNYPGGVSADGSGNIYVSDTGNNRIQKFSAAGAYLNQWGTTGSNAGSFNYPQGIASDGLGNVFVADTHNNRIQEFSNTGTFLSQWGIYGSAAGNFNYPYALAIYKPGGSVYVADAYNNRLQKFTSTGSYLAQWGSYGTATGQFEYPKGVAVDSDGSVYVADTDNNRIQVFSGGGVYLRQWGSYGTNLGQFEYPHDLAVDWQGDVYVADGGGTNNRIEKFTTNGTFLAQWGTTGAGSNQFNFPARVAVDQTGNFVYVADANNNRVDVFAYAFSPQLISTAGILSQPSFSGSSHFAFEAEGLSGYNYVVQFSTNLVNWTSVETNSVPFTFVNTNSSRLPYTFYRTMFQP